MGRSATSSATVLLRLFFHFRLIILFNLQNTAITAAHCCRANQARNKEIVAGQLDVHDNDDPNRQTLNVVEEIVHPDYNPFNFKNDICVLVLDGSLEFNE